jgi:hypothetical protein
MLGIAVGEYKLATSSNTHASLTMDIGDETQSRIDDVLEYASGIAKKGLVNVLFFDYEEGDSVLIGWYGTEGQNWFPLTSGNFFTEEEQGEYVAFVSDNTEKDILEQEEIYIGDEKFRIVGTGWIVPWSFATAISASSNIDFLKNADEVDVTFTIIPFERFVKKFEAQQILIQFNYASYSELENYAGMLKEKFPDSPVYVPDKNSDDVLRESQIRYGILAMLLCILAGVTVIRLMCEWISTYTKEINVLWVCGMRKSRCVLIVYEQWLFYFLTGSVAALLLHYLSSPLLGQIYADNPPVISSLIFALIFVFVLSILCTIRKVSKALCFCGKEGVV